MRQRRRRRDWRDITTRVLLIAAGAASAAIFILRGDGEALPLLAVGGMLGATLVSQAERD